MTINWRAAVWVAIILMAQVNALQAAQGPLEVRNRFPLHLLFLTPRPEPVEIAKPGDIRASLAVDYSAVFFDHRNDQWDFLIDMEMTTIDFSFSYGLHPNVAVKLDIPVVCMDDGFLDGFLENYHDALNLPNYGRESRPKNAFAYHAVKQGTPWFQSDPGDFRLADVTFSTQFRLPRSSAPSAYASTLIAGVKLPTGDETRGFGSGAFDYGLYWNMQWAGHPWSFFLMPGAAVISDPDSRANISARNCYSLFAGVAYDYNPKWTWLVQVNSYTSPVERTGIGALDDGAVELALGCQYRLHDNWLLEFAFCEDLTRAAPDFSIHLGLTWQMNSRKEDGK